MFWNEVKAHLRSLLTLATPTACLSSSKALHQDQSLTEPFPYALPLSNRPLGQVLLPAFTHYLQTSLF